jgi:CRP/FNR family transcriptional regulator
MYDVQSPAQKIVKNTSGAMFSGEDTNSALDRKTIRHNAVSGKRGLNSAYAGITLLSFPFLQGVKNDEIQDINSRVIQQKFQKKEYIYLPYNRNEKVFFIVHGNVEIGYLDESGRELSLDILGAGEIFGCFTTRNFSSRGENRFGESTTGEFARVLDKTVLAVLNKNDFEMFLEKYPRFAFKIFKMMNRRISILETKLQNLVFSDVKTRICKLLFSLYQKAGDKQNGEIRIPLTHQDIANLVASSRETASLHLSELKKTGAIAYERKRIRIVSISDLKKCSTCCS